MTRTLLCISVIALGLSACEVVGIGNERSLALLGDSGIPVPDTVTRNVPFTVNIAYYGSSSCTRLDEVDVTSTGAVVTITPHVERPRTGACTGDLKRFTAEPEVTVSASGPAAVNIVGLFDRRDTTVTRYTYVQ